VLLRAYGLHTGPGDEGIYFYLARRVAEDGLIPYRDFFFSHPPVHVLTAAAAFFVAGPGPTLGKLLPALFSTVTVVLVYGACLRRLGRAGAVTGTLMLALSYDFLRSGSHFTGVNLTLALSTAGAALAFARRPAASGVASAAAVLSGVYAGPTALGCGLLLAVSGRRALLRFAAAFLGVLAAWHGLFLLLAGRDFLDQVYGYHLAKPGKRWAGTSTGGRVLIDNVTLCASFFLALGGTGVAALRWWRRERPEDGGRREKRRRPKRGEPPPTPLRRLVELVEAQAPPTVGALAALLALGNLVVLSSLQRAFPFYFLLALPALAVCCGYAGRYAYDAYVQVVSPSAPGARRRGATVLLAVAVTLVAATQVARAVRHAHYPRTVGTTVKTYTWAPAPHLPGFVDAGVRKLLWLADRQPDTTYSGVRRYLWHECRRAPLLEPVAAWVEANTPPDGTLFGDSLIAPWVAFLSGRRVAGEQADSNAARFRSGASTPAEVIASVEADGLAWVLGRRRRGFYRVEGFRRWLDGGFEQVRVWPDYRGGRLLALRPRGTPVR